MFVAIGCHVNRANALRVKVQCRACFVAAFPRNRRHSQNATLQPLQLLLRKSLPASLSAAVLARPLKLH
jgi:hypothetical protein